MHGLDLNDTWRSFTPLPSLLATLVIFQFSVWLNRRLGGTPLLHPVISSIVLMIVLLRFFHIEYSVYFEGARFINFLLGPAIVALAVPLHDHLGHVRRLLWPIAVTSVISIVVSAATVLLVGMAMGARRDSLLSLAPKSVTSPIAMGIADALGGIPALAAGLVFISGALGCLVGPWILKFLRIKDHRIQGFAMGLAVQGFGTAQCFSTLGPVAGAFAGLGMGLGGLLSTFIIPIMTSLLGV
ncbi:MULTISPECIES: LrgB family protein [Kushneria]|uniref:Uncharacterized protein n=2 Tax=Kushneria TaxID=504090 RepID=A0A240UNU6_9GAMM|nr:MULTISPECIES: LrgB family protein [Kushneria]ARS52519.1 hypothetical protein B9G99_06195 [Kushneria konosiri]ART63164.1 hypothetical protein B9H00_08935 [Kushneria marisflavi]RKD84181.1 putative effector of murein hydrolase [Kushneria marisflavi]